MLLVQRQDAWGQAKAVVLPCCGIRLGSLRLLTLEGVVKPFVGNAIDK